MDEDDCAYSADELLSIGEVSARTGVASSALRFYEEVGLIASTRTSGNQRRYARHMLRRVALVTVAKRLGIPLEDVLEAFRDVPLDRRPSHEEWQTASRRWKSELEERRTRLEALERELTGCIGCGCLSMKACRLLNPADRLASTGSGAVRLQQGAAPA
jgi:MerR family transcriptional regulator, redox-sensitive transcriptional activator SoxR